MLPLRTTCQDDFKYLLYLIDILINLVITCISSIMKIRLCKKCNNPISKHKDSRTIYCSTKCAGTERKTLYRKCARPECNNLIPPTKDYRQKYCSHSCSAKSSNSIRKTPRTTLVCLYCGKKLTCDQKKYCSHKCQWLFEIEFKIKNNYYINPKSARAYYIYIRGHKCEDCKLTIWRDKPIFLSLHHINGWEDNSSNNVKLLCGNCHPLTDTFGNKNIGKGRRINKPKRKVYRPLKKK